MNDNWLRDPQWVPDRIDPVRATVTLVPVTPDRLRAASFLDGREPFKTGPGRVVPLSRLSSASTGPSEPVRTILHVSFCGSTLLSRLLDVPGCASALREPRVQIDLADWRAAIGTEQGIPPAFTDALRATTVLLGRPAGGRCTIVKPTNWANVLLPHWAEDHAIDPVFVTMRSRAFLVAVFRGGRDRLAFTIRAAMHFARISPDGAALVREAVARSPDPLDRAARLAVAALAFQLQLFDRACVTAGWHSDRIIESARLRADPTGTALAVAKTLHAPINAAAIEANAAAVGVQDAKAPTRTFRLGDERRADDLVEAHHGHCFDAALRWAEQVGLA